MWAHQQRPRAPANSNVGQIISLSDIFISPLEDMYVATPQHDPSLH
jgi:hypothetical protein